MIVKEELEKMRKMGVITESQSTWHSPIVLVPKPDGLVRFCIDFHKVNKISKLTPIQCPM